MVGATLQCLDMASDGPGASSSRLPKPIVARQVYDGYGPSAIGGEAIATWKVGYFIDHFSALLPRDRGASIVEVGCGQGENLQGLRKLGYSDFCGIDISEAQLTQARSEFGLVDRVAQADAVNWLAERPATFDCILAIDLLEHLELAELLELGRACRSALQPSGQLLVQVPNGVSPMNPIRDADITHVRAFTVQSLEQFFRLSGLKPVAFHETPPRAHSVGGAMRRGFWKGAARPALRLAALAIHGPTPGTQVLTANMIGIAEVDTNGA